jgi:hypothetical protein
VGAQLAGSFLCSPAISRTRLATRIRSTQANWSEQEDTLHLTTSSRAHASKGPHGTPLRRKCYDRAERVDRGVPACGPKDRFTEDGTELLWPLISTDPWSETLCKPLPSPPAKTSAQECCRFTDQSIGTLAATPSPTLLQIRIPDRLRCFCPRGEERQPRRDPQ